MANIYGADSLKLILENRAKRDEFVKTLNNVTMGKTLPGITRMKDKLSPLERAWEFKNYIGSKTGRHDQAREIGAMFCDLIKMYVANDKMIDRTDDDCTEYWEKTKEYLLGGR